MNWCLSVPDAITRTCSVWACGKDLPCPVHSRPSRKDVRSAFVRGYDKRWQRTSRNHLRRYPRCGDRPACAPATTHSRCLAERRIVSATVTDHIIPHRGDLALMWAESNRQSLCASCHGVKSRAEGLQNTSGDRRSDA